MMTIPNLLTIGRISSSPCLPGSSSRAGSPRPVSLFVAGMSDAVDGFLARHFNQKSSFGAYMDPLADKTLLVTSFVVLCYIGLIPTWLMVITVARDLMILSGFFTLYFSGVRVEMRPLAVSKATTFLQLLTVFTMLGSSLITLPGSAYTRFFWSRPLFPSTAGGATSRRACHSSGSTADGGRRTELVRQTTRLLWERLAAAIKTVRHLDIAAASRPPNRLFGPPSSVLRPPSSVLCHPSSVSRFP